MIDLEADRDMLCQRMWATNNGFLEAYPFPQEFVLLALVQSRKSTPCSPQSFYLFANKSCCRIRHLDWLGPWLWLWGGVNKSALTMLSLQTDKSKVSMLCSLAQVALRKDPWDLEATVQGIYVYHKCPCFPTNSFLPKESWINGLLTLHLCQHFIHQYAKLILFLDQISTFEERKWWREESYFVSVSVFQVVAFWLVLEEVPWLSAVLMKYGRYHLDLLCGLAEKCVPSFCSFDGLQARQTGLWLYFPKNERVLCKIWLSHHRGAQYLCC